MSRDSIVREALSLFADEGFDRVTLRTLGDRVGLHNSSLFHHFRAKGEIVQGALERVGEGLLPFLEPLSRDDPPRLETLLAVVGGLAEHLAGEPQDARFLLRVLLDPGRAEARPRERGRRTYPALAVRLFTALSEWMRRAQAAGAIRPVSGPQVTRSLLGALLLEPALGERAARDPQALAARRAEMIAFTRGALASSES